MAYGGGNGGRGMMAEGDGAAVLGVGAGGGGGGDSGHVGTGGQRHPWWWGGVGRKGEGEVRVFSII